MRRGKKEGGLRRGKKEAKNPLLHVRGFPCLFLWFCGLSKRDLHCTYYCGNLPSFPLLNKLSSKWIYQSSPAYNTIAKVFTKKIAKFI